MTNETTTAKLTCTHMLRINDGHDGQGRPLSHHRRCRADASEIEIKGMLTTAKAILCSRHAKMANEDAFISERGWPLGKTQDGNVNQARITPAIEVKK